MADVRARISKAGYRRAAANVAKARTRDSMQALSKLTHVVDGRRRIVSDPPLIVPIEELVGSDADSAQVIDQVRRVFREYRRTLSTDRRHLLAELIALRSRQRVR